MVWGMMSKKLKLALAGGAVVGLVSLAATQNPMISLQQALNQLAGNFKSPYTALSTQQAANTMLANELARAELDSLVGVVTFVWDDNRTEIGPLYDSLGVWAQAGKFADSFTSHGLKGGFAFESANVMSADSNASTLSISEIRALVARGNFDVGTVGWDETSGLYNGDRSLLVSGAYSVPDTFYNNILNGVKAQRDTLGLGMPKWISHSNSSGAYITSYAARRAGIQYGYGPQGTPSLPSSEARPYMPYQYYAAQWGAFGTGGAGHGIIAVGPGQVRDRYNITQGINEAATLATWKKTLDRAAQVHGLAVFIGHRPDLIGAAVAADLGLPTTGTAWTATAFDSLCSWIKVRYIDTGLLRAMTPGDAADHFFKRSIGPFANFALGKGNFDDIDGDGHLDGWSEGAGDDIVADTALVKPSAFTGHGGKTAYSLNWGTGIGSAALIIPSGGTPDSTWEGSSAILGVFPPAGGGWTAHVEFWAICDTTVAGAVNPGAGTGTTTTVGAKYVGASIYAPDELYPWRWGTTGSPHYMFRWGVNQINAPETTIPGMRGTAEPIGTRFRLCANNNIHRNPREWANIVVEMDIPSSSKYVLVSIYKHKLFPAGEVIISDYSVTFYRRDGSIPNYVVPVE